mgnify:CR=1 FL=1
MSSRLSTSVAAIALGLSCFATGAQAGPFTSAVLFGDSLSDTGNVKSLTTVFTGTPFPNYADAPGRFSNGPVWVDRLAADMGLPALGNPAVKGNDKPAAQATAKGAKFEARIADQIRKHGGQRNDAVAALMARLGADTELASDHAEWSRAIASGELIEKD